jgi:hypothetical protein
MKYEPRYIGDAEVWCFAQDNGLDELIHDGFADQLYYFALAIEEYVLKEYEEEYKIGETELDLLIQRAVEKE